VALVFWVLRVLLVLLLLQELLFARLHSSREPDSFLALELCRQLTPLYRSSLRSLLSLLMMINSLSE
jgi:hypothetical protein